MRRANVAGANLGDSESEDGAGCRACGAALVSHSVQNEFGFGCIIAPKFDFREFCRPNAAAQPAAESVGKIPESLILVRAARIELAPTAWKAVILPLYDTRGLKT